MKSGSTKGTWHDAADDLQAKLSRYASKPRFAQEFSEAFSFFFGEDADEMQGDLEPAAFNRFMEWFVYDYRLSNDHRIIEMFDMEYGVELSSKARCMLTEWSKSCFTILQLREVAKGNAVGSDLLLGGDMLLQLPPSDSVEGVINNGSLLIGRPIKVGELWELSGGVSVLPERLMNYVIQLVQGEYRRFRRNGGGSWHDFLHEQGFVFNDLIEDLEDEWREPIVLELFVRIIYDVVDMQACIAAMSGTVDYAQVCQLQGEIELMPQVATWAGLAESLRLSHDRLEVRCASQESVLATKLAIESRLGSSIQHRFDVLGQAKPNDMLANSPLLRSHLLVDRPVSPGHQEVAATDEASLHQPKAPATPKSGQPKSEKSKSGKPKSGKSKLGKYDPAAVPVSQREPVFFNDEQREAANIVTQVLAQAGASQEHIDSALWLWSDYCVVKKPRSRFTSNWAAAVHFILGVVEEWDLDREMLAKTYGITRGELSKCIELIMATLDIKQYDDRYCVEHPVDGFLQRLSEASDLAPVHRTPGRIINIDDLPIPTESIKLFRRLVDLRAALAEYAKKLEGLSHRAQEQFLNEVGCSSEDHFWQDCFTDWVHFDWAIPVLGGHTMLEEALQSGELDPEIAATLAKWVDCHPMYYKVDSINNRDVEKGDIEDALRLVLRPLRGKGTIEVIWPTDGSSLRKSDIILARIVPLDGYLTSVGHSLHFSASDVYSISDRMGEEKKLLEQWNGRTMKWMEIYARYAGRMYGIAYRTAKD